MACKSCKIHNYLNANTCVVFVSAETETNHILGSDVGTSDSEEENTCNYVHAKLGGGFSINDILKSEYCFSDVSEKKESSRNPIEAERSIPNISIPNNLIHIASGDLNGDDISLNNKDPSTTISNASSYCEYFLQIQEKIHRQLLLNQTVDTPGNIEDKRV